jgi:hypothetical protein
VFGYCQSFCVNNKNEVLFQTNYSKLEDYIPANDFLENFMLHSNSVCNASMAVFKKEYYYRLSDYFKTFRFAGDWIFWSELSRMGNVYISAKPLNFYRKHDNDISGKMYASGKNFIEEIRSLDYFKSKLGISKRNYLKAKIKVYARFLQIKNTIDKTVRDEIKLLFEKRLTLFQRKRLLIFRQRN